MIILPVDISGVRIAGDPLSRGVPGHHIFIRVVFNIILRSAPYEIGQRVILYIFSGIEIPETGISDGENIEIVIGLSEGQAVVYYEYYFPQVANQFP